MKTKTNGRKDKQWIQNPDQLKNPKILEVKMVMSKNGFQIIGGQSKVLMRDNQHTGQWVNVDVRDLARELNRKGIRSF